jgi:hypothetical protein
VIPSRLVLLAAATLALVACGAAGARPAASPASPATASKAADFRVHFDILLGEHVLLAARVTGAALAGRTDEYTAYAGLLTHNGTDLGSLLDAALGADAQARSDELWASHDTELVEYAAAVAAHDQAARTKAVQALNAGFVAQFAGLFSGAAGLPAAALTELANDHVTLIEQLVDDQARKDWPAAYADLRTTDAAMRGMGDTLASAIARKAGRRLPGAAAGKPVDLRVALDLLLQEHAYLATGAAGAAIDGRTDELQAAQTALAGNGADLGMVLGAAAGANVQAGFDRLWSAHDGSIVDYTMAVARGDRAGEQHAVADLNAVSVPQFASFLAGATSLREATLANLLKEHVSMTKDVIDALGRHDVGSAARDDRLSAQHIALLGDSLAAALVAKRPQKFL